MLCKCTRSSPTSSSGYCLHWYPHVPCLAVDAPPVEWALKVLMSMPAKPKKFLTYLTMVGGNSNRVIGSMRRTGLVLLAGFSGSLV